MTNDTEAVTLTGFLLARIAEDEAQARRMHAERCDTPAEVVLDTMGRPMAPSCDCDWYVARVLAECEAKRRLLEWLGAGELTADANAGYAVRVMAAPYADHPDYRDEWKP